MRELNLIWIKTKKHLKVFLGFHERGQRGKNKSELRQEQEVICKREEPELPWSSAGSSPGRGDDAWRRTARCQNYTWDPSFEPGSVKGASEIPDQLLPRPPLRIKCKYSLEEIPSQFGSLGFHNLSSIKYALSIKKKLPTHKPPWVRINRKQQKINL